jgi:LmbE family N-acetylglucosaminyl deacetylase
MQLFTRVIDVGYSDRSIQPVNIRFVLSAEYPFPSSALVNENRFRRGTLGWIREATPEFQTYRAWVEQRVSEWIADDTIIVLPEFGGSPQLTTWMVVRMQEENARLEREFHESRAREAAESEQTEPEEQSAGATADPPPVAGARPENRRCIIVGGTYYRWQDAASRQAIESVCPVILPDGSVEEQLKLYPAADEQEFGCSPLEQGLLLVFQNTGWGDFAVLICSDALHGRCEPALAQLRGRIDFLIVVARNSGQVLRDNLRQTAGDERWVVAYCNGYAADSAIFTPVYGERMVPDSGVGAVINVEGLHRKMAEEPGMLARRPQIAGFEPRPRHYSVSVRSTIDFRRFPKVLAIGSHFDDVWLGCSATLMLLHEVYGAQVACASLCSHYPHPYFGQYILKDRTGELHAFCAELCGELGFTWIDDGLRNANLADRAFPAALNEVEKSVEALWNVYRDADLVFIPRQDDAHEDHVLTAKTVLKRFRRATILEYEVKEFRRVPFQPSLVVDVTRVSRRGLAIGEHRLEPGHYFAEKKAFLLEKGFGIAFLRGKLPSIFERYSTLGRMRVRSAESSGEPRFAEAFATEILIS